MSLLAKERGGKRTNLLSAVSESVLMHGRLCLLSLYRSVRKESVKLYKSECVFPSFASRFRFVTMKKTS